MMTRHLSSNDAYSAFAGVRVRVIWNPHTNLWLVYGFDHDRPLFSILTVELHTVSVYGELKPKFAPDGSPSFVGTIVGRELVRRDSALMVKAHPYCPAKLFFDKEPIREFDHCRRLLLDGSKMYADFRPLLGTRSL
jgi:hypothetical protein